MINPTQAEVEALTKLKLVGFYNSRFDNHILYAALLVIALSNCMI